MKERDDALWMAPWAPRVLKFNRPSAGGFLGLTALWAEGCGGGFAASWKGGAADAAGCVEGLCQRVQRGSPYGRERF